MPGSWKLDYHHKKVITAKRPQQTAAQRVSREWSGALAAVGTPEADFSARLHSLLRHVLTEKGVGNDAGRSFLPGVRADAGIR